MNKTNKRIKNELAAWQQILRCFEPNEQTLGMIRIKGELFRNKLETKFEEREHEFLLKKIDVYQKQVLSFSKSIFNQSASRNLIKISIY
jgi:hypothetical protein